MAMLTSPRTPKERRLSALVSIVVLAALVTLGWQMRPVDRGAFLPTTPPVFGPAPPWASPVSASTRTTAHPSRWPVSGGDGSVRFVDVAQPAGLRYRWSIPGPRPLDILQTIGNGCALLDYDGDGNLDVLLVGTDHLALYKGDGHGHFADVSHATGLDRLRGHFLGCAVGDYDNDGFEDVYISGYRTGLLLHNEGGKRFNDVTAQAGLKPQPWGTAAAFAEIIPGSGKLDLFVGNYVQFGPRTVPQMCAWQGVMVACGPGLYQPEFGALFHNLGAGRFKRVGWGVDKTSGKVLGAAFADYDGSGRQSLYLANDMVPGNLLHNDGTRLVDAATASGMAFGSDGLPHGGMGLDWGDYDNDGRLDLMIGTFQNQAKSIFHNSGNGLFDEQSGALGLVRPVPYVTFGVKWLDIDNDGWLDLLLTSGHIQDNVAQASRELAYRQPTLCFHNEQGRRLVDVSDHSEPALSHPLVGRGLAVGDFDNDGRVDALVVDSEGAPLLLRNQSAPVGHWLSLKLVGTKSNRDGIGALVTVTTSTPAGSLTQTRLCHTDGSYLSASDVRVHVGLGRAAAAQTVSIKWPSGHVDVRHHVRGDRQITIHEGPQPVNFIIRR